jgi:hypothetical protein
MSYLIKKVKKFIVFHILNESNSNNNITSGHYFPYYFCWLSLILGLSLLLVISIFSLKCIKDYWLWIHHRCKFHSFCFIPSSIVHITSRVDSFKSLVSNANRPQINSRQKLRDRSMSKSILVRWIIVSS